MYFRQNGHIFPIKSRMQHRNIQCTLINISIHAGLRVYCTLTESPKCGIFIIDNLIGMRTDNGKPAVMRGRKGRGLTEIAHLPKCGDGPPSRFGEKLSVAEMR